MKPSLVSCIFLLLSKLVTYGQTPGSQIFGYEGIHDIRLTFTQPDFWDSLLYYKETGDLVDEYTYMPATVDFDGQIIDSTGVRLKGNSSYNAPGNKKSIKLKFNEFISGQKLDGLKRINLNNNFNDPTLMREKLFLDILINNQVNAPRCSYARVYINSVYWGLYTVIDPIDKVFLLSHFQNKDGNLFKGDKDPLMPCADLSCHTEPMEYRNCYTLKTNEELDDWSELEQLINCVNNTAQPEYFEVLNSVLNTASFINAWATNIVFVNVDSYVETGHNYYIYHNPVSGKFEWITWDVNEAFGLWNVGMPLEQLYNLDIFYLPPEAEVHRPLSFHMLQDNGFRKLYTDKVYELVCTEMTPEILFPKIDELYYLIREDVYADSNKILSNEDFDMNINEDVYIPGYPGWVPGLKSFIQLRYNLLMDRLIELGYNFPCSISVCSPGMNEGISVYPNLAGDYVSVEIYHADSKSITIELLCANGQTAMRKRMNSNPALINLTGYPAGIYFLRVIKENSFIVSRIIKY